MWEEENGYGWDENSMGFAHLKAKEQGRDFLVVQWLRICLPMQGHRFNPWSGKIPHDLEQLCPCISTDEPTCCNC